MVSPGLSAFLLHCSSEISLEDAVFDALHAYANNASLRRRHRRLIDHCRDAAGNDKHSNTVKPKKTTAFKRTQNVCIFPYAKNYWLSVYVYVGVRVIRVSMQSAVARGH